MKKIIFMFLTLVMCLSLAACGGGVDASETIDTFNSINNSLTEVSTLANDNIDMMDQATVDTLTQIANTFAGYKTELESEDLTQERADAILSELAAYPEQIAALKTQVEGMISAGGTEPETSGGTLLDYVTPAMVPDGLAGTSWEFAGGFLDGTEMEQADAEATLAQYGGTLQIVFDSETDVSMVQGGGTLSGTYTTLDDGTRLGFAFDNAGSELKYGGLFADVNGTAVLMLLPDGTYMNAIYFSQITED